MNTPLFVRPLTENERSQIHTGFYAKDVVVLRRSHVLQSSERGE